jgi:hypothetical protein
MPRLRPRLIALVIAFPLVLLAFLGWLIADDPVTFLNTGAADAGHPAAGGSVPLWQLADYVVRACVPVVLLELILGALVVAVLRARRRRSWAGAGNVVAAAIVGIGPAPFFAGVVGNPDYPAPGHTQLYLLALLLGVLVGIAVLANAAARAQSDRRTARLMVVPAATLSIVLLATFVALVTYAVGLVIDGVPLIADTGLVQVYPVDALPSGYAGWLPTLIASVVASLVALSGAVYAMAGAIRGAQIRAGLRAWWNGRGERSSLAGHIDEAIDLGSFGLVAARPEPTDGGVNAGAEDPQRTVS